MNHSKGFPERIACLTEETTETLYLLGEDWRIVGISGFTVRSPRVRHRGDRAGLGATALHRHPVVSSLSASWYFSLVFAITSAGRCGAGARLFQSSVSR